MKNGSTSTTSEGEANLSVLLWEGTKYLFEPKEEFLRRFESLAGRVYGLQFDGEGPVDDFIGRLYTHFFASLIEEGRSKFFVHHFTQNYDLYLEWGEELRRIEPTTQTSYLRPKDLKKLGLKHKFGPVYEIALSTTRVAVLQNLFSDKVDLIWFESRYSILDGPESEHPLSALRALNLGRWELDDFFTPLTSYEALISLEHDHGPVIYTLELSERRIEAAAMKTARELGMPLNRT